LCAEQRISSQFIGQPIVKETLRCLMKPHSLARHTRRTMVAAWEIWRLEVPGEEHLRFLRVVYDLTNGDPEYGVETAQVAQIANIPYTIEDALAVSRELRNAELIKETGPLGTIVSLTDDGKRFVEENT
jgi:predicted transcriptional regulator